MKREELIIELPHLQTFSQRMGSWFVSMGCWLLWIYFLIPLLSLSGWLLGIRKFSSEVRWFGGYKSLIDLLEIYGLTILAILLAWMLWTALRTIVPKKQRPPKDADLSREIAEKFASDPTEVIRAQNLKAVTLHFDENGTILRALTHDTQENAP